jgi:hypothetical protein
MFNPNTHFARISVCSSTVGLVTTSLATAGIVFMPILTPTADAQPIPIEWVIKGNELLQRCGFDCGKKIGDFGRIVGDQGGRYSNYIRQNDTSPLPKPSFSQNRYGYTQTCNQYGCVSVPNH